MMYFRAPTAVSAMKIIPSENSRERDLPRDPEADDDREREERVQPHPGARPNGLLAQNAMTKMATADARIVATAIICWTSPAS